MIEMPHKYSHTDERRAEIAAAARSIILEKGFEGLRTREIAARVGINISTLHYHVPSKKALVELVAATLHQDFNDHYAGILQSGTGPLDELRGLIADYKDVMLNRPELLQLVDVLGHRAAFDPELGETVGAMRRYWLGLFVNILQRGKDIGTFRASLNPEAAAHMIAGALVAFQYKPRHLMPLFDGVADEIIRSVIAIEKER
jgi:AcrR family transcriptional regulator